MGKILIIKGADFSAVSVGQVTPETPETPEPSTVAIMVLSENTEWGETTGSGTYAIGSQITIKATPRSGYIFVKWSDGDTNATRTVTVREAITYTAIFAEETRDIQTLWHTALTDEECNSGANARTTGLTRPVINNSNYYWYNVLPNLANKTVVSVTLRIVANQNNGTGAFITNSAGDKVLISWDVPSENSLIEFTLDSPLSVQQDGIIGIGFYNDNIKDENRSTWAYVKSVNNKMVNTLYGSDKTTASGYGPADVFIDIKGY
jgi:uncharacterized repeat protein (TIGR02543 family)